MLCVQFPLPPTYIKKMLCVQFPLPPIYIKKKINNNNHITMRKKPLSISKNCRNKTGMNPDYSHSPIKPRLAKIKCCGSEEKNQIQLPGGLEAEGIPKHVAVIMDGNRRWAKSRGLSVGDGHRAGGRAMKQLALQCQHLGVQVLTVFAFSTENWFRPKEEVEFLMELFKEVIQSDSHMELILKHDVRVSVVGDTSRLPVSLQSLISSHGERAKGNKGLHLVIALNYSGRYDITQAARKIASKVKDGVLQVEGIDETIFEQHLETNGIRFPNPDLLIRTSGELRLSNFMLWQLAYTELLFVDKLFPDFDEPDLVEALTAFQRRRRRFGGHKY